MRATLERANAVADELRPRDWRVLLGVLAMTASYSKTHDRMSRKQIAEAAGVSLSRTSESLRRLTRLGVIAWRPSRLMFRSEVELVPAVDTTEAGTTLVPTESTSDVLTAGTTVVPSVETLPRRTTEKGVREVLPRSKNKTLEILWNGEWTSMRREAALRLAEEHQLQTREAA